MSFISELAPSYEVKTRTVGPDINVGQIERLVSAITGGAVAIYGLTRRSPAGLILTLAGAALLHRGSTGHCNTYRALRITTADNADSRAPVARDVHVEKAIIIDATPEELYRFWLGFENLPRFMKHLKSVSCTGLNRWHWVAPGPAGTAVEWDAEIYNEKPNELIAWRSLEGADITNAGSVRFKSAGERGTEVKVNLNYNAPGGKIGAVLAKLFDQEPGQMIEADLRRLKQLLESGEVARVDGQPSGRDEQAGPLNENNATKTASKTTATKAGESHAAPAGDLGNT